MTRHEDEDDSAFDRNGVLRDGAVTRVRLVMRDGAINPNLLPHQQAKAAQQTEDAVARRFGLTDGLQLHKPGFRRVTDAAALERMQAAYTAYNSADAAAYKQTRDYNEYGGDEPRNTGTGAPNKGSAAPAGAYPLSAGEGSSCSIDGTAGTLVRQGNWLVCRPARRQSAATIKQAAYDAYDADMANAWRNPR